MKNDIFLILAMLGSMSYGVAQTPSESPLVTEAKKRQEKVRSLRCVYEMKEFFAEGSRTEQSGLTVKIAEPGTVSKESTPSKHYPEKDVIVDTRAEIIISGEMARFEETAPEYIVKEKTYKPSRTMYSDNLIVKKRSIFNAIRILSKRSVISIQVKHTTFIKDHWFHLSCVSEGWIQNFPIINRRTFYRQGPK